MSQVELVVGWDGRPSSVAALACAVDLAQRLDAHIHVVHVADFDDMPIDPDSFDWEQQFKAQLDAVGDNARAFLSPSRASWTYHSAHGQPSGVISRLAEEVDALMVILGSRRGGVRSFIDTLTGLSVSHQLFVHHSRPLLLVSESAPVKK